MQLVKQVHIIAAESFEHSYFPLQRILAQHPHASQPAFLDTTYEFYSSSTEDTHNQLTLGDVLMYALPHSIEIDTNEIASKFDFSLNIHHDPIISQLSCRIDASLDLFDAVTVNKMAQRFHLILKQLFMFSADRAKQSICKLSLLLPEERLLIHSINNTTVLLPPVTCLHYEFICRASKQPQKVAMQLDEQSLTYSELIYYVQLLALHLLQKHDITPGEIVCQCVERSLSMVSICSQRLYTVLWAISSSFR